MVAVSDGERREEWLRMMLQNVRHQASRAGLCHSYANPAHARVRVDVSSG
jgi:hypothetical protein